MNFPTPSTSVGPVIRTQHVGSDLVIDLGLTCLVASASCPDSWHEVVTSPAHCTCASWAYRGKCRHHAAAVQAQMAGMEEATPVEAPAPARFDLNALTLDDDCCGDWTPAQLAKPARNTAHDAAHIARGWSVGR